MFSTKQTSAWAQWFCVWTKPAFVRTQLCFVRTVYARRGAEICARTFWLREDEAELCPIKHFRKDTALLRPAHMTAVFFSLYVVQENVAHALLSLLNQRDIAIAIGRAIPAHNFNIISDLHHLYLHKKLPSHYTFLYIIKNTDDSTYLVIGKILHFRASSISNNPLFAQIGAALKLFKNVLNAITTNQLSNNPSTSNEINTKPENALNIAGSLSDPCEIPLNLSKKDIDQNSLKAPQVSWKNKGKNIILKKCPRCGFSSD